MDYRDPRAAVASRLQAVGQRILELEQELGELRRERTGAAAAELPPSVFVGLDGTLRALHRGAGQVLWAQRLGNGPVVVVHDHQTVYAGCAGKVHGLDPASGVLRWTNPLAGFGFGLPVLAVAAHGFAPAELLFVGLSNTLLALDANSGAERWRVQLPSAQSSYTVNFVLLGEEIFAVSGGALTRLDARTGEVRWCNREAGHGTRLACLANHDLGALLPLADHEFSR